ncbi:crustacean hyperglycemic hormones-like [Penaeus chinensis]|uniref:crustacean hyperglycemic hormones-like n=1 Tax=Penaeus chinensis TaxID=139456 RepID=UPI001FB64B3B|nr:crustacean hyperglycemic hormones-like [Penaeus chinensis]
MVMIDRLLKTTDPFMESLISHHRAVIVAVGLMRAAILLSLPVAIPASATTSGDGNQISTILRSSPQASPVTSLTGAHTLDRRSLSFRSYAGVYDRELLVRRDRVCEDCYNVYRDVGVAAECRINCFHNEVFLFCVDYMFRPRQRNQYRAALQRLGK